jgi:NitT/TauT family transport system ATP-binding protein
VSGAMQLTRLERTNRVGETAVALSDIHLAYRSGQQEIAALENVTLQIGEGKFVAVVGPSGCGKSTLLHLACGILKPSRGSVSLFGKPVTQITTGVGYVFQSDGLLAWKTISDNIGLPLRLQGRPASEVKEQVEDWLRRTGLSRFGNAYPSQLSGGMRKRVALAQALITHPRLLLMDEPLSALDVQTRTLIGNELMTLWHKVGNTVLLVTHDLEEAIGMADEVVVMTARPARVKSTYTIDLPRPRDLTQIRLTQDFQDLYAAIWSDLREEVLISHARYN